MTCPEAGGCTSGKFSPPVAVKKEISNVKKFEMALSLHCGFTKHLSRQGVLPKSEDCRQKTAAFELLGRNIGCPATAGYSRHVEKSTKNVNFEGLSVLSQVSSRVITILTYS